MVLAENPDAAGGMLRHTQQAKTKVKETVYFLKRCREILIFPPNQMAANLTYGGGAARYLGFGILACFYNIVKHFKQSVWLDLVRLETAPTGVGTDRPTLPSIPLFERVVSNP